MFADARRPLSPGEFSGRFGFSVSHTTRQPRPGEEDGVHYNFTTLEAMRDAIADDRLVLSGVASRGARPRMCSRLFFVLMRYTSTRVSGREAMIRVVFAHRAWHQHFGRHRRKPPHRWRVEKVSTVAITCPDCPSSAQHVALASLGDVTALMRYRLGPHRDLELRHSASTRRPRTGRRPRTIALSMLGFIPGFRMPGHRALLVRQRHVCPTLRGTT